MSTALQAVGLVAGLVCVVLFVIALTELRDDADRSEARWFFWFTSRDSFTDHGRLLRNLALVAFSIAVAAFMMAATAR